MFCRPASALPGCWVDIPLFCRRKKFSTKTRYTIRRRAIIFPHVENPVEKVQKSSFKACFACGIPHFPQGFPLFGSTFFDFLRTICRIQVGNMTIFWTASCPLLPNCPISFWRMWICVENPSFIKRSVFRPLIAHYMEICCILSNIRASGSNPLHPARNRIPALLQEKHRFGLILAAVWGILIL